MIDPEFKRAQVRQLYREHLSGYQRRDYEVVDYRMEELPGTRLQFRGPFPDFSSGNYFTCIGAAQTFGCFCDKPYPALLSEELGLPVLNLGYGGAGPEFFERHESLDRYINGGQFVVLQVMSGRSQSNSIFECRGLEYQVRRRDGLRMSADAGYSDLLNGIPSFDFLPEEYRAFCRRVAVRTFPKMGLPRLLSLPRARAVIAETRRGWIENYKRLLARIEVPVVLLWFSKRTPDYGEDWRTLAGLFGEFPQLVNRTMVSEVSGLCDDSVECVTSDGSPQPLFSRFTGQPARIYPQLDRHDLAGGDPWTHNLYYPSPEMHRAAAMSLRKSPIAAKASFCV